MPSGTPAPVPAPNRAAPVAQPASRKEVPVPAAPTAQGVPVLPVPAPAAQPAPAPAQPAPAAGRRAAWGIGGLALAAAIAFLARRSRRRPAAAATLGLPVPAGPGGAGLAFGPYRATRELGRGGCATAYFAYHQDTGAEVAIKVPHAHLAEDPDFRARFRREASLGALLDHPRVVKIIDPGPAEGDLWLAMAFIRGITLDAFMSGKGPLPVAQAVAIAADIAEAIAYAHGKGVVHRDLKPANVMLGDDGAVVMDFGIARMLDAALTSSTMYLGTPLYCAPEGVLGSRVGPPADRYALGMILFEMLAGHAPFQSDNIYKILEAQQFEPLPDLGRIRPYTPPRLVRLVERLCAKAPEDRPEDPETLAILGELRS
jgi:serine/threonine-protein kinase